MARGTPGAFGRHIEALYVWLPLSVLFVFPFIDRRRWRRLLHLDLLVLSSLSVSLAFFDHGDIGMSVPLAYPPLLYLLVRLLWIGLGRGGRPPPLRLNVPASWLAVAVVFLLAFRIGLEVADANVIDVGYATAQGAHQILAGKPLYGHFPAAIAHGDTYGPVTYEAYVPGVALLGFSGRWDSLPAVRVDRLAYGPAVRRAAVRARTADPRPEHGRRARLRVGFIPVHVVDARKQRQRRARRGTDPRGALLAEQACGARRAGVLAALTKLAPIALLGCSPRTGCANAGRASWRCSRSARCSPGALALEPALRHDSLREIYERTVAYQATRSAPFSLWGLYGGLGARADARSGAGAGARGRPRTGAAAPRRDRPRRLRGGGPDRRPARRHLLVLPVRNLVLRAGGGRAATTSAATSSCSDRGRPGRAHAARDERGHQPGVLLRG